MAAVLLCGMLFGSAAVTAESTDVSDTSEESIIDTDEEALCFTEQPEDATVSYPEGVSFHAEVNDPTRVASWQWYLKDIDEGEFLLNGVTASTDTLTLLSTQRESNQLRFICKVTDIDGNTVTSEPATLTIGNMTEHVDVLYVCEYALTPGEELDLSTTQLGSGVIRYLNNGDMEFDNINFHNDWFSAGTSAGNVAITHEREHPPEDSLNVIFKGENIIDNLYYNESINSGGFSLDFCYTYEDKNDPKPHITFTGPGSLTVHGGVQAIRALANLTIDIPVKVTPKHLFNDGISGYDVEIRPGVQLDLDVYGTAISAERDLTIGSRAKLDIKSTPPYVVHEATAKYVILANRYIDIDETEINIDVHADPDFFQTFNSGIGAYTGICFNVDSIANINNSMIDINMTADHADKMYAADFTGINGMEGTVMNLSGSTINITIDSADIHSATGIFYSGQLNVDNTQMLIDIKASDRLRGVVAAEKFNLNDSGIQIKTKQLSGDDDCYGFRLGTTEIKLSGDNKLECAVDKGIAFLAYTGEQGRHERYYESGYVSKAITLKDKTECIIPQKNEINIISLPGLWKPYEYYETYYDPADTSQIAKAVTIAAVNPVYTFDSASDNSWKKGSSTGLNAVIKRDPNDDKAFAHFTGVKMDGADIDPSNYTAESGSVKLALNADYMETLAEGSHELTAVFDDGEVKSNITVSVSEKKDEDIDNTPIPKKSDSKSKTDGAKTGDDNDMMPYILLTAVGVFGLLCSVRVRIKR